MNLLDISKKQFIKESEATALMVEYLDQDKINYPKISKDAAKMIEKVRSTASDLSVEVFLDKYNLTTKEGTAIMCLAEALLRIPDRQTADKLIESTFEDTNWDKYLDDSDSFFVNAASWGMLLTGKTVGLSYDSKKKPMHSLRKVVKKTSEPIIRQALKSAMRLISIQFVMGEDMDSALKKAQSFQKKGYCFSYDMLGEGARSQKQADGYFESYKTAIQKVAKSEDSNKNITEKAGVSIKLTALHPRYELLQKERVMNELVPKLVELIRIAQKENVAIAIDAEESRRLDIELEIFTQIRSLPEFAGYDGIGFVLQAYQKRAFYMIDYLVALAKENNCIIPIRLVKGAYWDNEIKHSQEDGHKHFPVFTSKHHSDLSYLACAKKILDSSEYFFPQFATHNAHSICAIMAYVKANKNNPKFEFQRLYGMGEKLYEDIVKTTPCRIYAPIGEHKDLLAYLIRRLLENGANNSFLNMLMDKKTPAEKLVHDPIKKVKSLGGKRNATLAIPEELYGEERKNSKGYDLGNISELRYMQENLQEFMLKQDSLPKDTKKKDIAKIMQKSSTGFAEWKNIDISERAKILDKTADLLEENSFELLALCIKEGNKTLQDSIAELREAVDFCRYYAAKAKELLADSIDLVSVTGESNKLSYHARGTFVCISPWNFPLAIFTGQIAAALICGNTVIAKPAEQTPIIAKYAVDIFHKAGVPEDVLQVVFGKGAVIGGELLKQDKLKGVCFTGSTSTAKLIQIKLATDHAEIIPLIAETGGQNCMIADSSTLPEQLCDDALNSAFNGAGQRCSALRVLFLPDSIADNVLELMKGAVDELKIGDPKDITTDIGPVIDEQAKQGLEKHISKMKKSRKAKLVAKCEVPKTGNFIAPQIWEIDSLEVLKEENFGPILHVIRYKTSKIDDLYEQINQLGFGLTFGMHTRIFKQYHNIEKKLNAGNIYINRNITGAVVGSQPFGGEGLSGTGFKAGGPNYLLRFVTERIVTTNSAAIGGNIDLLMKS